MYTIEDLTCHCLDNGETVFYKAKLRNNDKLIPIILNQNSQGFFAYVETSQEIYPLITISKVETIGDLRNGDEVELAILPLERK